MEANRYFIVKDNIPIFTNDTTAKEVSQVNWTYEDGKPISGCLRWDEAQQKVVRDIPQEKNASLWELKQKREELIFAPLNNFDVDEKSLNNINEAVSFFEVAYPSGKANWIMADNSIKEVTKQELEALRDSFLTRKLQLFSDYQAKKKTLENATTYEEIKGVSL